MRKMNPMYRAMLFVWRKKGKTASLFLTIFVIAVFLVSCFGVLHASKRLSKDIRTSLGAAFYIRANTTVSTNENGQTEVTENEVHMTQKEIDEVMRTGEIKYCNPINYGFAKSDAIEFIPGEKHTKESSMGKVTALRFCGGGRRFDKRNAYYRRRYGKNFAERTVSRRQSSFGRRRPDADSRRTWKRRWRVHR